MVGEGRLGLGLWKQRRRGAPHASTATATATATAATGSATAATGSATGSTPTAHGCNPLVVAFMRDSTSQRAARRRPPERSAREGSARTCRGHERGCRRCLWPACRLATPPTSFTRRCQPRGALSWGAATSCLCCRCCGCTRTALSRHRWWLQPPLLRKRRHRRRVLLLRRSEHRRACRRLVIRLGLRRRHILHIRRHRCLLCRPLASFTAASTAASTTAASLAADQAALAAHLLHHLQWNAIGDDDLVVRGRLLRRRLRRRLLRRSARGGRRCPHTTRHLGHPPHSLLRSDRR